MPTTLLLDTNRAAYPIYQALQKANYSVTVVGSNPNEPLAKLSPNYLPEDYSDAARMTALLAERKFDSLVPGCTDLSYQVCATINQERFPGLDSPETTARLLDKSQFHAAARELGLSVPRRFTEPEASTAPAVIIKPADTFSGRGVQALTQAAPSQLTKAIRTAQAVSPSGRALLEEFITGQLVSHSAFVREGRILADFFVREDGVACPFAVDTSCLAESLPHRLCDEVRRQVVRFVAGLGLVDGLVHSQFIAQDERFWFIEVTRRCPGDLYALLIEFATGYPYAASYAAPFIGKFAGKRTDAKQRAWIIRHTVTAPEGQHLWGLRFQRPVQVRLWVPLATAGDWLAPAPAGRAAILFLQAQTAEEQAELYQSLLAGALYTFA